MKRRWLTIWTLTYKGEGSTWYGTCPRWAGQPVPKDATLIKHRVLTIGAKREPCIVPGCKDSHLSVKMPDRVFETATK